MAERMFSILALFVLSISSFDQSFALCRLPNRPEHGVLIYQSRNPRMRVSSGYTVKVICNSRYRLSPKGNGFMTCADGGWTPKFDCAPGCEPLPPLQFGEITYQINGTVARHSCSIPGHRLYGNRKRRCRKRDLTWTGVTPECHEPPTCPETEVPSHVKRTEISGRFRENLWTVGSTQTFSCRDQRQTMDVPSGTYPAIECLHSGWNATIPTCIEVTCPPIFEEIENGRSLAENRPYFLNEKIEFICDPGYRPTGTSRACVAWNSISGVEGSWEGITPECEVTTCPRLRQIQNGVTISASRNINANATFTCNSGYILFGDESLTCLSTGCWNGSSPVCKRPLVEVCHLRYASEDRRAGEARPSSEEGFGCPVAGPCHQRSWSEVKEKRRHGPKYPLNFGPVHCCESLGKGMSRGLFNNTYGVDWFLMFDASTSVGERNFMKMKRFAMGLVKEIGVTDRSNSLRVGAMYFSRRSVIAFNTVTYNNTEDIVDGINDIPYTGGSRNTAAAFRFLRSTMLPLSHFRENGFRVVFLITDGEATEGGLLLPVIELEEDGVKIFCLGVSLNANKLGLSRIASEPKREYLFFLKDYYSLGPLIRAVTNQTADYSECGLSRFTVPPRGRKAWEGAWPWQILVEISRTEGTSPSVCGGTLLRNDAVLTAAHCVTGFSIIKVYAGVTDRQYTGQVRTITEVDVIIHEEYDPDTLSHNIALILVDPPFTLSPNVRPACLPNPEKEDRLLHRGTAVMTGWGHEGIVPPNASPNFHLEAVRYLRQLSMPLKTRQVCSESLVGDPEASWFDESMTCAGFLNKQLGPCQGDSGGPLVKYAKNGILRRWTVIGISSWGRGCAVQNELDFFTNVPHFVDWIEQSINSFVV